MEGAILLEGVEGRMEGAILGGSRELGGGSNISRGSRE